MVWLDQCIIQSLPCPGSKPFLDLRRTVVSAFVVISETHFLGHAHYDVRRDQVTYNLAPTHVWHVFRRIELLTFTESTAIEPQTFDAFDKLLTIDVLTIVNPVNAFV